jgi:hypothetical protein
VQQKGAFMSIDALTSAGVPVHFELPVASCKQLDSSLVPIQPAAASLSSSIAPLKQRAIKGMNSPEQNVHQNKKQQVRMGALILVFAGTLLILLILVVLVVLSQTYQKKINHIRDEL